MAPPRPIGYVASALHPASVLPGGFRGGPTTMKTLYTAEAISKGGRRGTVWSSDRVLHTTLGNPLQAGAEHRGPSPEMLFAGAYAACFHGALRKVAEIPDTPALDSTVRARVSLVEDDAGGSHLAVALHALLPGVDALQAQRFLADAHQICPYSKALRGGATVTLVLDDPVGSAASTAAFSPSS
jgi:osmotically inducible protein OsmC